MLAMRLAEMVGRVDFWKVFDEVDITALDWWFAYGLLNGWFPVDEQTSKQWDQDSLMEAMKARYG